MQRRASKGGEFGANGEWYEGGKFLNTTPENAKREGSAPRGTGRQEIAPYVWDVPPVAGARSIYRQFAGVFGKVWPDGVARLRTDDQLPITLDYCGTTLAEAQDLIDRWNSGTRWKS
jgi:hypothetical protein